MGASFQAFIPTTPHVNVGYRHLHWYRQLLLRCLGLDMLYSKATEYAIREEDKAECNKAWDRLNDELDLKSQTSDIAQGIKRFVIHSDCDGEFSTEYCQSIGKAMIYFFDHKEYHEDVSEESLKAILELGELFQYAGNHDGLIKIF